MMMMIWQNGIKGTFVLQNNTLSIAFIFSGKPSHLGWSHNHYIARRNLQRTLQEQYPNITFQNTYDIAAIQTNEVEEAARRRINEGANIIIGCDYWFEETMIKLSTEYTSIYFINSIGSEIGGENYLSIDLKAYQIEYMLGYIAGSMTETNKIGRLFGFNVPYSFSMFTAFIKGAKEANPLVKGHIITMNAWGDEEKEKGAIEIFKANNIDFIGGSTHEGYIHNQGILSVGEYYDWEINAGEGVMASSVPSWEFLYIDVIDSLIENGTMPYNNIYAGIEFKGPPIDISQLSVKVNRKIAKRVFSIRKKLLEGKDDIFCGPMKDYHGTIVIENGTCLNETQIKLWSHVTEEDTVNFGDYEVPYRQCEPGTYYIMNYLENKISCFPCPAGTASKRTNENSCFTCPPNFFAQGEGNVNCTVCPAGHSSSEGSYECRQDPLPWYAWLLAFGLPVVMLIIGFLLFVCSVFIIQYLVQYIKKQRRILRTAENMSISIAKMDLDNETLISLFSTPFPTGLDIQFRKIIENLRVYRPYLPDTLFAKDDIEEDTFSLARRVSFSSSRNKVMPLTRRGSSSSSSSNFSTRSPEEQAGMVLEKLQHRMQTGLELKTCTLMVVDFKDINQIASEIDPENLAMMMNQALSKLTIAVKRNNGVIHSIQGDKILCSWNAVSRIGTHSKPAVESSIAFLNLIDRKKRQWEKSKLPIIYPSISIYTGECLCGTLGSHKMRSYTLFGPAVNIAYAMTKINRYYNTTILMNDACKEKVKFWCKNRIVDKIQFMHHRNHAIATEVLYEVLIEKKEEDSSWLVSSTMNSTNDVDLSLRYYNMGMISYMNNNLEEAKDQFDKALAQHNVNEALRDTIEKVNMRMEHDNIEPPAYVIHGQPELN